MHYALKDKYPIETEEQIKTAMTYFDKYITRLDPIDRAKVAMSIEKRASDLGVNSDKDWIHNYSRLYKASRDLSPDFQKNLDMRKVACEQIGRANLVINGISVKASDMLDKIAEEAKTATPTSTMMLVVSFDKTAGLEYHYDRNVLDPIMTVFGSVNNPKYDAVKIAGDMTNYDIKKIRNDKPRMEKIAAMMGKKFHDAFKADPIKTASEMKASDQTVLSNAVK